MLMITDTTGIIKQLVSRSLETQYDRTIPQYNDIIPHLEKKKKKERKKYPEVSDGKRIITLNYLSNHYSDFPLDFLIKQAEKFKFDLLHTVVDLETNISVDLNGIVHYKETQTFPRLSFPRNIIEPAVAIDEEMENKIDSVEDFLRTSGRYQQALSSGTELVKCSYCNVSSLPEDFLQCKIGCLVCTQCFKAHLVLITSGEKDNVFKCISQDHCRGNGFYTEESIRLFFKDDAAALTLLDDAKIQDERTCKLKRQEQKEKLEAERESLGRGGLIPIADILPKGMVKFIRRKMFGLAPWNERYQLIAEYYKSTYGAGQIRAIIEVSCLADRTQFGPHFRSVQRFLLWHGTPEENVVPILNTGLKCTCWGLCFFASTAQMSNGYAQKDGNQNQYYMFVVEVCKPKCYRVKAAAHGPTKVIYEGLSIPSKNAEWVVGKEDRIRIRYLLVYTLSWKPMR